MRLNQNVNIFWQDVDLKGKKLRIDIIDSAGPLTSYSEISVQVQATNQQHGQLTDTRS